MTTNSCAAHAVYRESQTPHEDIRAARWLPSPNSCAVCGLGSLSRGQPEGSDRRFAQSSRQRSGLHLHRVWSWLPVHGLRARRRLEYLSMANIRRQSAKSEVACPMDFATTARSACLEVASCTH
jgi:hypothetical protein